MALKHARPEEVVDLRPLGAALDNTKTSALVKTSAFEAVRLIVQAGAELPPHKVSGPITLHCIEGHAQLGTSKSVLDLRAGDWVYLEGGEMHWVKGVEPSSLLLTILFDRSSVIGSSGSANRMDRRQEAFQAADAPQQLRHHLSK